jgi:hypothetical protein
MTWLVTLGARLKAWAIGIAVVLAAIASAWLLGRRKGEVVQKQAQAVSDAQANAQAAQQQVQAQETRNAVEAEISKLPNAQPQTVATADPATAAGQLRTDGWLRAPDDRQN